MNAPLLAFDTSTEALAVAVQSQAGVLTFNGAGGAAASAQLLPQIRRLMLQAGLDFPALSAVAFGGGPGAFTGLRTSCAVAQGLAFGAALPVLALDSLLIVAEAVRVEHRLAAAGDAPVDIHVAMDARMGEVYAGAYRWGGMRWLTQVPPALCTLPALHAAWAEAPPQIVCGSALGAFGERLNTGRAMRIEQGIDRAAASMRLAQQLWREGAAVDAAQALPLYLRDKVALTVAERQARRPAGTGA